MIKSLMNLSVTTQENKMTIQEANQQIAAIFARSDIGEARKQALAMRVRSQARRENPEADHDELL